MFVRFVATLFIAFCLSACSPNFNWREARFDGAPLVALLPCKPERAERTVPLLGEPGQRLQMAGCPAGGASFTVSVIQLPAGLPEASVREALARWEQAGQRTLKAPPQLANPVNVKGAASARLVVTQVPTDRAVQQNRSIYAHTVANGSAWLVHAQVLGLPKSGGDGPSALSAEAFDTFLSGLSL
jgi:hypothetical protein